MSVSVCVCVSVCVSMFVCVCVPMCVACVNVLTPCRYCGDGGSVVVGLRALKVRIEGFDLGFSLHTGRFGFCVLSVFAF